MSGSEANSATILATADEARPPDAAQPAGAPATLCAAANLTEAGLYGRRWLVAEDGRLRVYGAGGRWPENLPRGPAAGAGPPWDGSHLLLAVPPAAAERTGPVFDLALSEVRGARVEPLVGAATLLLETPAGPVPCIRFTPELSADFGLAARMIGALARGEPPRIDPRDLPQHCPRCGRRLQPGTRICPPCIDRGAVLRRLLGYAGPYRWKLAAVTALMLTGVALSLVPAQINRALVDDVLEPRRNLHLLGLLVLAMLGTQIAGRGLSVVQGYIGNSFGSRIVGDIRASLWGSLQRLSLGYFDKAQIGNLMSRVSQDTSRMQTFLTGSAQQFLVQAMQLLGVLAVMLAMNWRLTLVVLIPAPFTVVVSRAIWPRIRRLDRRLWHTVSRLNTVVNDALGGIRVVKAFGQEGREVARFGGVNGELVARNITVANMMSLFGPSFTFVAGFGTLLVWYFGGILVVHRHMDLGTLLAFATYLGMVLQPLTFGSRLITDLTTSITSAERVFEVMDTEPDVGEAAAPVAMPRIEGRVSFAGVEFGYVSHLPVLRDIDLDVAAGEMIGLVGHSGAGKSTMINLICRLYDAGVGTITIDGVDIRRIRQDDLRRQIGVVLQETFLFDGSIAENIAYARPDADPFEIMEAARIANAHDFILGKPEGYDTRVGERGMRLSGGERQRIAIARAILHDPRILILDEATASVDSETERQIQEAVGRLVRGRTTFAIAHRLSTLRSAHRLAVFDHGRIVEIGTHDALMDRRGVYYRLVKAQQDAHAAREVVVG